MDPYVALGVPRDCTLEEVKGAFRAMALQVHPDHGGDGLSFIRLRAAYKQILEDLERSPRRGVRMPPRPPRDNRCSKPPIADWDPDVVILPKPADPNWKPEVVLHDVEPRGDRSPEPIASTVARETYLNWLRQVSAHSTRGDPHWTWRLLNTIGAVSMLAIMIFFLLAPFWVLIIRLLEDIRPALANYELALNLVRIVAFLLPLLLASGIVRIYSPEHMARRRRSRSGRWRKLLSQRRDSRGRLRRP